MINHIHNSNTTPVRNTQGKSIAKTAGASQKTAVSQPENSSIKDSVNVTAHNEAKSAKPASANNTEAEAGCINKFTPLIDDEVMTADVMKEVANAEKSILFETYLLNGKDGKALSDLLIRKKKEGLEVKVMLDPSFQKIESWMHKEDPLYQMGKHLKENGVEFLPYPIGKMSGSLTPSEHAKILIVDEKIAYLGGTNIDDTYNHDINVKIEGPAAKDMRKFFDESWKVSSDPDPNELGYTADPKIQSENIKLMSTSPSRSTVKPAVLKNIKEAKDSIRIEMFTLTDDEIETALVDAKKRGVDVKVILCDNKEIFHLPTFHVPNLAAANKFKKAGIPVKWYVNDKFTQMHSKLCVFDSEKVMLGSANFIHGAFKGIHEYYGEIKDKELAQKMEAHFEEDWKNNAVEVDNPNFAQRMLGGAVELIDDVIF